VICGDGGCGAGGGGGGGKVFIVVGGKTILATELNTFDILDLKTVG
jgi:hypothetical protein